MTEINKPDRVFLHARVIHSVSLSPPAVRMLAVRVGYENGKYEVDIFAAVSIRTTLVSEYSYAVYPTEEELASLRAEFAFVTRSYRSERAMRRDRRWRWVFETTAIDHEFLVNTHDGLHTPDELQYPGSEVEVLEAPWPREQDEERLAELIQQLKETVEVNRGLANGQFE